jgi:sec-independent protein translocase protein TatB
MFGIGGGELVVILILLLVAVGPDRMPTFMKAVGKGVREFRRTTREIRSTVGLDELMRDEDFRDPLGMKKPVKPRAATAKNTAKRGAAASEMALSEDQLRQEQPPEGVDIAHVRSGAALPVTEPGPE